MFKIVLVWFSDSGAGVRSELALTHLNTPQSFRLSYGSGYSIVWHLLFNKTAGAISDGSASSLAFCPYLPHVVGCHISCTTLQLEPWLPSWFLGDSVSHKEFRKCLPGNTKYVLKAWSYFSGVFWCGSSVVPPPLRPFLKNSLFYLIIFFWILFPFLFSM